MVGHPGGHAGGQGEDRGRVAPVFSPLGPPEGTVASTRTRSHIAKRHTFKELKAEVEECLEEKRALPRKDGYGLRNIIVELILRLTREQHELVRKGLEKIAALMRERLGPGAPRIEPEEALIFLLERVLETEEPGAIGSRVEGGKPIWQLLYRLCPRCRKAAEIMTEDGPVEVPVEHAEAIEGEAEKVEIRPEEERKGTRCRQGDHGKREGKPEIDPPTPPALRRKVKARDGHRCANPYCRHELELQCHHWKQRAKGGATAVWNEFTVCSLCHCLLHQRLLVIEENADGTFTWIRRADGIAIDPEKEAAEAAAIPLVIPRRESAMVNAGSAASPTGAPVPLRRRFGGVARALVHLGYAKGEAVERIGMAVEFLAKAGRPEPSEQAVLETAISGRVLPGAAGRG